MTDTLFHHWFDESNYYEYGDNNDNYMNVRDANEDKEDDGTADQK